MKKFKLHFPTVLNWSFWSLLYLFFLGWHGTFEKPLSLEEINFYSKKLNELNPDLSSAEFQKLLERDRGKPIYMVNAIKHFDEPVKTKDQIRPMPSREVIRPYNNYVGMYLIKNGSYPVFLGDAMGGTAAKWGVDYEGEWSRAVIVRYRNIRTLLEMATKPEFNEKLDYKKAALERTIAYPTEARFTTGNLSLLVFFIFSTVALVLQLIINKIRVKN
ncbi:MAG: hypothetical protein PVH48_00180 [Cyclobacteriaceae bacterium]|jgi:hypothetical protein